MVRLFRKGIATVFLVTVAMTAWAQADSVTRAIAPEYDNVSNFHRFWLGQSHRALWAAPVKVKVFDLKGYAIMQRGGGLQTKSLRLRDESGREWVLRSVQKYPERGMPANLKATVARDILQDQVSTAHPYASVTVPVLAGALEIPHTNPQIVFMPDDPALGEYRADFANTVLLFEEREPDNLDTDNTPKVQGELEKDNDVHIRQKLVLRARLLDMLLGDWDRHEDQWRWQKDKKKGETTYSPVPRDRDQVYYTTSGVLPWFLSHQWLKSKFQGFHETIRDINGFNFNARFFDRYFLNEMSEDDWKEQLDIIEHTLTDSLLEAAVRRMPDTIYALSGREVLRILKVRRSTLRPEALNYYRFISKYVDIPASDKHEYFDVVHKTGGRIEVTIYKIKKDGTRDKELYHRVFHPEETKEIRLYGFGDEDQFTVSGHERSSIIVRLIGGVGKDRFDVAEEVRERRRLYIYDRKDEQNVIPPRAQARLRVSNDSLVNSYNKNSFAFDRLGPMFSANYNFDDGIQPRVGILYEKQGFRRQPYASRHDLQINYSTGRKAFLITYAGDIKELIGKNDLVISVYSRGPHNTSNFFGIGNDTEFLNEGDQKIQYYRSRYDYVNAEVKLKRALSPRWKVLGGVAGQFYNCSPSDNAGRFIDGWSEIHPDAGVYATRYYAGLATGLEYDTRNSPISPTKGLYWHTSANALTEVTGDHPMLSQITSEMTFYFRSGENPWFVLANRLGGGTTLGDPAFFQRMRLGGVNNLRGFHTFRFTGTTMVYYDMELRLKLFDFTSYLLPGSVGLIAFNDIGRVWVKGESSATWHDGYGGGIYVVPADLVILQGTVGFSKEGLIPYIAIGYRF